MPDGADQAQRVLSRLDPTHEEHKLAVAEPLAKECGTGPTNLRQHTVWNDSRSVLDSLRRGRTSCRRLGVRVRQDPSARRSSSRRQPGSWGRAVAATRPPGYATLRDQRRSRRHRRAGSIPANRREDDRLPWALATRASSKPSRDIPKRWSSRARSSRSVQAQKRRTGRPIDFEVPGRLDELVLAPSGGLERE